MRYLCAPMRTTSGVTRVEDRDVIHRYHDRLSAAELDAAVQAPGSSEQVPAQLLEAAMPVFRPRPGRSSCFLVSLWHGRPRPLYEAE
jgi:hypothetical protein